MSLKTGFHRMVTSGHSNKSITSFCDVCFCWGFMFQLMYVSDFRPIYAGNTLCTVKYTGEDPCMMSIRSTSFSPTADAMSETKVAPITQVDLSFLNEGLFGSFTMLFC